MRAAAAEIARERSLGLVDRGVRLGGEKADGSHHHAVGAVAALRCLLGDERCLHRVRLIGRAEPFDRRDGAARGHRHRQRARPRRCAIDEHRAGAALCETAAELDAGQAELIAQNIEQWLVCVAHGDGLRRTIDA